MEDVLVPRRERVIHNSQGSRICCLSRGRVVASVLNHGPQAHAQHFVGGCPIVVAPQQKIRENGRALGVKDKDPQEAKMLYSKNLEEGNATVRKGREEDEALKEDKTSVK